MDPLSTTPGGTPAATSTPNTGGAGTPDVRLRDNLGQAHADVLARHGSPAGSRFAKGGIPWNKGRRTGGMAPAAAPAEGPGDGAGLSAPLPAPLAPPVDLETVRRLAELGFVALDETLQLNMARGWFALTGDKDFSTGQAEFYALKESQKAAIAESAALVAEKYGAALRYLPELALVVTAGTYGLNWAVGFNKLKQAALLKAAQTKPASVPTAAPAPAAA